MQSIKDYLRGKHDCMQGIDHKAGQSKCYDSGYNKQYQLEQILTSKTGENYELNREKRRRV